MAKVRADQLLVDAGLAESRARAQALILAGLVYLGDRKVEKAGQQVPADAALDLRGRDHPWVSRGGIKLAHALEAFAIDVTGFVAMDVGSSTGGFTEVLLTHGAAKVYAVDSGTNQLAWKLRSDDRVIVHEQTSARILTQAHVPEPIDIVSSLEHRHEPPTRILMGNVKEHFSQLDEILISEPEMTERVTEPRIKAGRYEDQVRLKIFHCLHEIFNEERSQLLES